MRLQSGKVPVVVFIHRRDLHLKKVLRGIRKYRPSRMFCFADTWEEGNKTEKSQCLRAREALRAGIDWPCRLDMRCAQKKLGLKKNVETGLAHVFQKVPHAIILEDDCVPTKEFFRFCEEGLRERKNDPKVLSISGSCFLPSETVVNASAYLSIYPHCWGWATWRRAWRKYSAHYSPTTIGKILEQPNLSREEKKHWQGVVHQIQAGKISSWAYLWMFAHWQSGSRSLNPTSNLVNNIGFDASAENTRDVGERLKTRGKSDVINGKLIITSDANSKRWDREVFFNHYRRISGRLNLIEKILVKFQKLMGKE